MTEKIKLSSNLDVLEWILIELSETDRTELASIKDKKELISFLNKHNIEVEVVVKKNNKEEKEESTTFKCFKAVVPAIYRLQQFINKIDNEANIESIVRIPSNGSQIKRLFNVKNYSQTMKNFYSSNFLIKFQLGNDKCIAIRENENWNSPNKDIPIIPEITLNQRLFEYLLKDFNKFVDDKIKEIIKVENEEVSPEIRSQYKNIVKTEKFKYKFNFEQAYNIFESYYGFNPSYSKNNGLYVLILELKENNFGQIVPVHEIKNIENDLNKAGILKEKRRPELSINLKKVNGNKLCCELISIFENKNIKLFDFNLTLTNIVQINYK